MLVSKKDIEYNKKSRIPRGFFLTQKRYIVTYSMRLIYLIKRLTNKKNIYADESNLTLNVTFKITNLSRREGDKIKTNKPFFLKFTLIIQ